MQRRFAIALLAAGLAGCGGGVWIGIDDDDWGDSPSVSIAAAQTTVRAGDNVRVVAAASDRDGIDDVTFFRLDGTVWLRLGADGSSPYEWNVTAPNDGRTTLEVFARARDDWGNERDSNVLRIDITP